MHLSNDELQSEYERLLKAECDRALEIAKRRKDRHTNIDFANPLFKQHLADIEQELRNRGLK